ncbi:YcjF family protein [Vibrio sp. S4M6]|uniref:YcjF family protein n=1 Tax=Vibrio sinus TaxID=2946865 RepID=UPI00202A752E|nr:TIGR01620 family protein [Vibrio sinus]MCL9781160.1 YcjF family protein [Vibrio sinus]
MSDFKSKKVFDVPLEKQQAEQDDLTVQKIFQSDDHFIPQPSQDSEEEIKAEKDVELIIRPKKGKKWLFTSALVAFAGLVGWQAIDSFISAIQAGNWLALAWAAFISAIASFGIGAVFKELLKLRTLRGHFDMQEQGERLLNSDSIGKGQEFCENIVKHSQINTQSASYQRWQNSVNANHSDAEVVDMFDSMVICEQDKLASKLVSKYATEAAALVTVSPLAIADMLLVAWRNFKMIDGLADIYGVELGYWSRLKLFKSVLINMAAIGATDLVIDASMDLMSMDLAKRVSARAGQGIGIGILTARLGIKAMSLLRPIPWRKEKAVKLSTIRKQIAQKIASISIKS